MIEKKEISILIVFGLIFVFLSFGINTVQADQAKNYTLEKQKIDLRGISDVSLQQKIGSLDEQKVTLLLDIDKLNKTKLSELKNYNIDVKSTYNDIHQIEVPFENISDIRKKEWVKNIRRPLKPKKTVVSEGVDVVNASILQNNGVLGENISIGVLDFGFNTTNPEIEKNIVDTKSFSGDGIGNNGDNGHGTAVAEIVVDVAPKADLYLASLDTDVTYANAVDWLETKDVDIIVMSLVFFNQPYDGTGFISSVADDAVENGSVWVNSAGNEARTHWEGIYSDMDGNRWLNWTEKDEQNTFSLQKGKPLSVYLSWDGWPKTDDDYDLYVITPNGKVLNSIKIQDGDDRPTESISTIAPSTGQYSIQIRNHSAKGDNRIEVFFGGGSPLQHNTPESSIVAPATEKNVISVGGFNHQTFEIEPYSSRGPTNDGRQGIDVVGPDGITTDSIPQFFGTSASAPHIAGIAGLIKSQNKSKTPLEIQKDINTTATDIPPIGPDTKSGYGIPNASATIKIKQNKKPKANYSYKPKKPIVGQKTKFNATNSKDPDGTITRYYWSLDDGTEKTGKTINHTYTQTGTYNVTLNISDNQGKTDNKTKTIEIQDNIKLNTISNHTDKNITITINATNIDRINISNIPNRWNLTKHKDNGGRFNTYDRNKDGHNETLSWSWPQTKNIEVQTKHETPNTTKKYKIKITAKGIGQNKKTSITIKKPIIDIYDINKNKKIDRNEVKKAIKDYLFLDKIDNIEIKKLIRNYLF